MQLNGYGDGTMWITLQTVLLSGKAPRISLGEFWVRCLCLVPGGCGMSVCQEDHAQTDENAATQPLPWSRVVPQVLEQDLGGKQQEKGLNPHERLLRRKEEGLLSPEARCNQELVQTGPLRREKAL